MSWVLWVLKSKVIKSCPFYQLNWMEVFLLCPLPSPIVAHANDLVREKAPLCSRAARVQTQHSSVACPKLSFLNNSSRQWRFMFWICTFCAHFVCVRAQSCVCVCTWIGNKGGVTVNQSPPPHHWAPRELLDAPQVLLNCTRMPHHHHHHLHSRDTLTRLLEEAKAC